jgi:PilZ domain-containing protein
MEHRLGHRLPTHEEIFVRIGAATAVSAVLTDMSVSGAFVRSESQPAIFSTVWVGWHGGEGSARSQPVVSAQVVRQSSDGFGIEWADFAPRAVCMRLNRHWLRESSDQLSQAADNPSA